MSRKIISEYFADEGPRRATVAKDLETGTYTATVVNESGSAFTALFDSIESAEDWAESWVMMK